MLLSTRNLKVRGIPDKLKKRFMGPFKIQERIGRQAYRLLLPKTWKVHPIFHISLLKKWNAVDLQEEEEVPVEEPEVEEPYYQIENSYGGEELREVGEPRQSTWCCGKTTP